MKLWSEDYASNTAIRVPGGDDWTYGDLTQATVDFSSSFGDARRLAFVWCDNGLDSVIACISAFAAGHVVFMGDSSGPRDELEDTFEPELVFTPEHGWRVDSESARTPLHPDLGLLLSTSGSTGRPRLVRLSRAAVEANAASISEYLELDARERAPLNLPLSYAYGLSILTSHLRSGASLVCTGTGVLSREFWDAFESSKCTSLAGVPYTWEMLLRLGLERLPLESASTFTQAGGHLSTNSKRKIIEFCGERVRFFVMYGQTEATARMSYVPPAELQKHIESVGIAIPRGSLSLEPLDDANEVIYEGPNVMMGCAASRADLTLGDDLKGRLETGDFGYFDADGFLVLTGRRGDFIKIFGKRVELAWVEESMNNRFNGSIRVAGEEDRLVVATDNSRADAILEFAVAELRLHRRAVEVVELEKFPTLPSGKVDRSRLLELAGPK